MKENRINMSTAYDKFNIHGVAKIEVEDIKEFTNKEGKQFCIIKSREEDKLYDIACTDLIYKQLRELPFLWSEIKYTYIISLKSNTTGFKYFMISKIEQIDGTIIHLTNNTSFKKVIEFLNEEVENMELYEEGDLIQYSIKEVEQKEVVNDGIKQTLYSLVLDDKITLQLTINMNKELNRIDRTNKMNDLTGIAFKCIDGIWKIAKLIF